MDAHPASRKPAARPTGRFRGQGRHAGGHPRRATDYDGAAPVPAKKSVYEPDRGPRPDTGYIAIQHHGGAASVTFKEISLH